MSVTITPRQRATLKARAHSLETIVLVGHAGLTDAVAGETDRALTAHGLIKVRIGLADRAERAQTIEALCARTDATLVQSVGKVAVLWRPRPDDEPVTG